MKYILVTIATWQLNHLLFKERGPAKLLQKIRHRWFTGNQDLVTLVGSLCLSVMFATPNILLTTLATWRLVSMLNPKQSTKQEKGTVTMRLNVQNVNLEVEKGDIVVTTKPLTAFNETTRQSKSIPTKSQLKVMDAFVIDCECQDKRRYKLGDDEGYSLLVRRQSFEITEVK